MHKELRGHFTGCYYFRKKYVGFDEATTIWSMFYLKARMKAPHDEKLRKAINRYFGKKVLSFEKIR